MKLYVPDPQKWVHFFERLSDGKATIDQSGAGRRPRVIPIDNSKVSRERKQLIIRAVLPAIQTAARAESELKREGIKPGDVVDTLQSKSGISKRKVYKNKKKVTKKAK